MKATMIPKAVQCNDVDTIHDHRQGCLDRPRGERVASEISDRDAVEVVFTALTDFQKP
jgi:hypothetical protein